MSNKDLSLAIRLYADTARFVSAMTRSGGTVRTFATGARKEFEALKNTVGSLEGKLASLGLSVGAVATIAQSAKMDKSLTQIAQTAGMSRKETELLRHELFRMAGETGQAVDDLQTGFNNAVQSGLNLREALPVIDATNKAMALTGASGDKLTSALTVAGEAFQFDLAKPGQALTLLDKMVLAGRKGNAEVESLADIWGRVGVNVAGAGMGFDRGLAFIEGLSLVERNPERLATLADSTLRLFTNLNYMKDAAKATGVKFFDAKGTRRDALDVLKDIKAKYDTLKTEKERALFIQGAFGQADLDTIKGMRTLLGGDVLSKVEGFSREIEQAGGTIQKDLPAAVANAVDQTGRLKTELRNAADGFAQPINDSLSKLIQYGLDSKDKGGMGLDGKDILAGGGALALGGFVAARYGGRAIKALAGKFGGIGAGVATGKALEQAAGVTPVYVVNMPDGGIGTAAGLGGDIISGVGKVGKVAGRARSLAVLAGGLPLSAWTGMGAGALATAGAGVAAAGAVGYGIGSLINKAIEGTALADNIGAAVAHAMAALGNKEAQIAIEINSKGQPVVTSQKVTGMGLTVDAGYTMVMP